jgi:error-prone DNA polymerase
MGFYKPATLIKDAQRHGLSIQPIHVGRSYWSCTLEDFKKDETHSKKSSHQIVVRLGLHYIKGLRKITGIAIIEERTKRPFQSIEDLVCRVPELKKKELKLLAEIGALNLINPGQALTRRDALWEIERASQRSGPLLDPIIREASTSPLKQMTYRDRILADFRVSGITVGKHLMALYRKKLTEINILRTTDLYSLLDGTWVQTAGILISRQQPGTAGGFVFISLEDETGITNGIITPEIFKKNKNVITKERLILIAGYLQRKDNTILIKVSKIQAL